MKKNNTNQKNEFKTFIETNKNTKLMYVTIYKTKKKKN